MPKPKLVIIFFIQFFFLNYGGRSCERYLSRTSNACELRGAIIDERLKADISYLYIKIPELPDKYLNYKYQGDYLRNKFRAIPILIEYRGLILNPLKQDNLKYEVSSHYKEDIIRDEIEIQGKGCLFMAFGSEYRFPVNDIGFGNLYVHMYFDFTSEYMRSTRSHPYNIDTLSYNINTPPHIVNQHFSMVYYNFSFDAGKNYQLIITPESDYGYKDFWYNNTRFPHVKGFEIDLVEMPDDTKFDFDGKADVGKTLEDVEKEFYVFRDESLIKKKKISIEKLDLRNWSDYQGFTSWSDAKSRCANLNMRLPSKEDLSSVYNADKNNEWIQTTYWTSVEASILNAYSFFMPDGKVSDTFKFSNYLVRCVK